jgi:hypothetical protein
MIRYNIVKDKFMNVDFSTVKVSDNPFEFDKYIIPSGVTHSPYDWCGPLGDKFVDTCNFDIENVFEHLNTTYLRDLRSGKAFLLLDQSHEGYQYDWVFDWFHESCEHYEINPKQILYVTGDMDIGRKYDLYCSEKGIVDKLDMISHAHFENAVFNSAINRVRIDNIPALPRFHEHLQYKTEHLNDIKVYNCLQKRPRAHRIWMFKELVDNNLLNDGLNSMNSLPWESTYYMGKLMDKIPYDRISKLLPMLPPTTENNSEELAIFEDQDSGKYQMRFNEDIMLDTWVSVISEASFGEDTCFISEKSFKPIAGMHPFIIFGNKRSLHYLRELGYKTFHPYIDESYDELECWERLDAIIDALKKIKSIPMEERLEWYAGMKEILEFNYDKLKRNSIMRVPKSMVTIANYFKD